MSGWQTVCAFDFHIIHLRPIGGAALPFVFSFFLIHFIPFVLSSPMISWYMPAKMVRHIKFNHFHYPTGVCSRFTHSMTIPEEECTARSQRAIHIYHYITSFKQWLFKYCYLNEFFLICLPFNWNGWSLGKVLLLHVARSILLSLTKKSSSWTNSCQVHLHSEFSLKLMNVKRFNNLSYIQLYSFISPPKSVLRKFVCLCVWLGCARPYDKSNEIFHL